MNALMVARLAPMTALENSSVTSASKASTSLNRIRNAFPVQKIVPFASMMALGVKHVGLVKRASDSTQTNSAKIVLKKRALKPPVLLIAEYAMTKMNA